MVTDQSQAVVWQTEQTPFGEVTQTTGTPLAQPLRFLGQYADPETGYSYNYFRDYDPSVGRYVQSDPIGLRGGVNTYGYVYQNPLLYTDPRGEFAGALGPGLIILGGGLLITCALHPEICFNPNPPSQDPINCPTNGFGGDFGAGGAGADADADADGGFLGNGPGGMYSDGDEAPSPGPDHPYDPGIPTEADGFKAPKGFDGRKTKKDGQYGWTDKKGNHWVPTNSGNAHGGPHWDGQKPGGGYDNVFPGGKVRPGRRL
ncbi:MAG: hypothetical protein IPM37_05520 [Hahellaceae bacterium]|nr:hypothetical protein [Hahellaceae bacterium]